MKLFEKYSGILQYALAVINTLSDADQAHRDEMLSAEKVKISFLPLIVFQSFSLFSRKDIFR